MKRLLLPLFLLIFMLSGCTTEKPAATTAETAPHTELQLKSLKKILIGVQYTAKPLHLRYIKKCLRHAAGDIFI